MMLTQCLQDFEAHHIVQRIQYEEIPPRVEYSLTEEGGTLITILENLNDWGKKNKQYFS